MSKYNNLSLLEPLILWLWILDREIESNLVKQVVVGYSAVNEKNLANSSL